MAVPIAELFISVSADVNGAISGLNALQNKLNGTTDAFQSARPAALALTAAAVGIGAGFATAVNVAADFEHQMSGVKAVMSTDEIAQFGSALSDLALKLGRDTVFTSREAAAGIEELIKAGVPAEAVLGGAAKAATDLAAATGIPVADAATVAAQAINTFGANASNLTPVVDRLAAVANASASDVSFLRFGLAAAGGVAAGFGVSLDDTLVTLGLLSNRFATGADAGTSFKTFLNGLTPDTKKQNAEFRKLGLITESGSNRFFDAAGNIKSMADVAGILRQALGGLTSEQRQATLTTLFGTDAQRAANALYELGGEKIREFKNQTGQSGVAAESATIRLDNLQGALGQLGGSFETVQIIVGNFFLPVIRKLAEAIKGPLDAFSTMSPAAQGLVTAIVGVAGAAAGVIGGLTLLIPIVRILGPSFVSVGRVLLSLVPAFRVVTLLAATLAASWATNLFGIREKVQAVFDAIPGILERVSTAFKGAADFWQTTIVPGVQSLANAIEQRVIPVFNQLSSRVGPLLSHFGILIQKAFSGDVGGAVDSFIQIMGTLIPGLGPLLGGIRTFAGNIGNAISSGLQRVGPILGNFGVVFEKLLAGNIGGAFDTVRAILGALSPEIGRFVTGTLDLLRTAAGRVATFWNETLSPALGRLGNFLATEVAPKIASFVAGVLPTLQTGAETVRQFWDTQFLPAFGKLGVFLETEVSPKIQTFVDAVMPRLNEGAQAVITFWETRLLPTLRNPGPILDSLATSFETAVGRIGTAAESGKLGVGAQALALFFANFDTIKGQVESLKPLGDAIKDFSGALLALNTAIDTLIGRSVVELFGSLGTSIQQFSDAIGPTTPTIAAIGEGLGKIGEFLQPATEFFKNLTVAINDFTAAVNAAPNIQALLTPSGGLAPGQQGPVATPQGGIDPLAALATGARGALGAAVPLISIGSLIISSEAEANAFIQRMADAIRGSSGRVNAPPDNSGNPQLSVVTP